MPQSIICLMGIRLMGIRLMGIRLMGIRLMGLALILLIFSTLPVSAQQSRFEELERVVMAELEQTRTPGAVVAIVQGDTILYQKGFGVANIETGQSVTPEMLFRIGSMTKMYTAAALVSLSEEGKIDLNAPKRASSSSHRARKGSHCPNE